MIRCEMRNLDAFRRDLSRASREIGERSPRAAKEVGERILIPAIRGSVPRRSGRLASSYSIEQNGNTCEVVSSAPYGAGAEWGKRGKWSGFRGPYAGAALDRNIDRIADEHVRAIDEPLRVFGWFHGR